MIDPETRKAILQLFFAGKRQSQIAVILTLPEELVADVLDCKL